MVKHPGMEEANAYAGVREQYCWMPPAWLPQF
jgi:hypothetical protein